MDERPDVAEHVLLAFIICSPLSIRSYKFNLQFSFLIQCLNVKRRQGGINVFTYVDPFSVSICKS